MPFHSPFNLPYFFRQNYRYNYFPQHINKTAFSNTTLENNIRPNITEIKTEDSYNKHSTCSQESSDEYFFEIFGLKLYFDDVLIMCLLYFLYTEGIQDQELFLCLILLLIS